MKVETITREQYVFEEGDVIADSRLNMVAIRHPSGTWTVTNGDTMVDSEIQVALEKETVFYIGNRIELKPLQG